MNFLKGNINKLYFTFLASALGSTLISSIYSTVDIIAMGHYLGPVGSAAISCVSPLWPCMLVLGVLAGMGGSVMLNNRRGAQDERTANEFFTLAMCLSAVAATVICLICNLFLEDILYLFGARGEVLEASLAYARPVAVSVPTFTLCSTAATFVRNDGEPVLPTVATFIGGAFNIFGDIFFVFDFGLGLGAFGAGLATALGQVIAFLLVISYFLKKKCKLKFTKPTHIGSKLLAIATVGASAAITEAAFGVTTIIFNNIISNNMTDAHLAVYGTAASVLVTLYCLYYALGTAAQPIVSANYGANENARVKKTLKVALISAVIMAAILTLVTQLFPEAILRLYMDVNDDVLAIGPRIMRLYNAALPFASVGVVIIYYMQSILRRTAATVLSLLRAMILPIIFCLAIPPIAGYDAVWLAVPFAEAATMLTAIVFLIVYDKKLDDKSAPRIADGELR